MRARQRQTGAYRPGTQNNRRAAIEKYVTFAWKMGINYAAPTTPQLCAYMEYLVEQQLAPPTIKNHISMLRAYFKEAGLDQQPLNSVNLQKATRAIDTQIRPTQRTKMSLSPQEVADIVAHIRREENGEMIAYAITIMFAGFFRQSNIAPLNIRTFDPTRQFTVADVKLANEQLTIRAKWSKTQQRYGEDRLTKLVAIPGSDLCPVLAHRAAQGKARVVDPESTPLIRFPDGNPIPVRYIATRWQRAAAKVKTITHNPTLHRLRLSGASWAIYNGATILEVCRQGGWASDAFRSYLVPPPDYVSSIHKVMASTITDKLV